MQLFGNQNNYNDDFDNFDDLDYFDNLDNFDNGTGTGLTTNLTKRVD